jgi:hypothetical protein
MNESTQPKSTLSGFPQEIVCAWKQRLKAAVSFLDKKEKSYEHKKTGLLSLWKP